ncbi:hypothetical protein [Muribaculum intestinale]|uniref:hypothetical protein n=1 Tax=Muribaculum intestinale TaxID=1796646 RepID=UPI0025A9BCC9|nr:hypothetical protein [Muribaculum intestinale]
MQLIIDGKNAILKQGSSFDYVSENRSFSDADDYTLSITLPLSGCASNIDIFGHIDRKDITARSAVFPASIIDGTFSKHGVITVVEASDVEIKCQFLEGRSVQNFDTTFDDIYINDLDLGLYSIIGLPADPDVFLRPGSGCEAVVLPWVNDNTGDIMNCMELRDGRLVWAQSTRDMGGVSFMPYLITIARRICNCVGYQCDFSQWESSDDRFLLVCNALPYTWDIYSYARALPHWSVAQFFEELERILVCEIDIDHRDKSIAMRFCSDIDPMASEVRLDNVLDSFSADLSYDDSMCQYKGVANIRYKECSYSMWKYYQCEWLIGMLKAKGYYREFDTVSEFLEYFVSVSGRPSRVTRDDYDYLYYVKETDRYYLYRNWRNPGLGSPSTRLEVNQFGDRIVDNDSDNNLELEMAPACIDRADNDHGDCLFLQFSSYAEDSAVDENGITQPVAYATLMNGEPDGKPEYYDRIYLAYWDGSWTGSSQYPPCPDNSPLNLKHRYATYLKGTDIDPKHRVKFSWISDTLPSPRSVFNICGKRYLCEKITATFTENGMSQLLKGEFFPLIEN